VYVKHSSRVPVVARKNINVQKLIHHLEKSVQHPPIQILCKHGYLSV